MGGAVDDKAPVVRNETIYYQRQILVPLPFQCRLNLGLKEAIGREFRPLPPAFGYIRVRCINLLVGYCDAIKRMNQDRFSKGFVWIEL